MGPHIGHIALLLMFWSGHVAGHSVQCSWFQGQAWFHWNTMANVKCLGRSPIWSQNMMSLCILILTLLPATSVASGHQGLWEYGIEVAGKSKKYGKQTPNLEAGMYGFKGGEELLGVKSYLYGHGKYQLVPVSNWQGMTTQMHLVTLLYF